MRFVSRALALVLLAAALTSCAFFDDGEFGDYVLFNTTDEPINVSWIRDQEVVVGPIPPHTQWELPVGDRTRCTDGILVAHTVSGREVARRTDPLCRNDMWRITDGSQPARS
jgi:hypothetical protein